MPEVRGSRQFLEVDMQAAVAYGPQTSGQNNGFPEGETTFAQLNTSPAPIWRAVPIVEDGFGLNGSANRAGESLKANIDQQRPGQLTGFDVSGALNPLAAPYDTRTNYDRSVLSWLMGAALNRSGQALRSYSMRWHSPGVSTDVILGAKCNTLTIEGSEDSGIISFNSEWVAASNDPQADAAPGTIEFPHQITVDASDSGIDALGWVFGRAFVTTKAEDGSRVFQAALRSFTVSNNNNLTPGAPKVKTNITATGCEDVFVVSKIREGQPEISGSFVIDYTSVDFLQNLRQDKEMELWIIGRHPQSTCFQALQIQQTASDVLTGWSLVTADTTVTVDTTTGDIAGAGTTPLDAYGLYTGGVVLIEDTEATAGFPDYSRDLALIKTGFDGSDNIVLSNGAEYWNPVGTEFESDGTTATGAGTAGAFLLFDQAFGVHVDGIRLDQTPLQGGPADVIGVSVEWTAGQKSGVNSAITWITGDSLNDPY